MVVKLYIREHVFPKDIHEPALIWGMKLFWNEADNYPGYKNKTDEFWDQTGESFYHIEDKYYKDWEFVGFL